MHNLLSYKVDNLAREFNTDLKLGLSESQIIKSKEIYGKNRIHKEEFSALKIFLSQFNIFVLLLVFSSLFSLANLSTL